MPLTFKDLEDQLKKEDEVTLLEMLQITSEQIVDRFGDIIELLYEELAEDYEDEVFGDSHEDEYGGEDWS